MKYYLISEQDVYDLSVEIENLVVSILEAKEVEEEYSPDDDGDDLPDLPVEEYATGLNSNNLNTLRDKNKDQKTDNDFDSLPF